ncbi:redox-regulated ATPase YchF [Candidatus Kuenenbacteria bacterium HGW-Kuenenbacteria-1]|uniref:Ribosome-binding ATPase YchF n=1 Tax=Candidatus Kuenenbacteria bacterium HGW-Kuenenbacteria-1 TaxID=2013812 RepID=A0A2N1UN63_9BACT|nr:MAG: redox-regulated ATPase YchF [Candidatus Kuenenbacteria bacterium HGW-Kuenenbacteria-1]
MLKIGIVGLPNVGKSTLFKALTKRQVDIADYPFCTIEPNIGIVEVPDERLEKLAKVSQSVKIIPTAIKFVDIAGLVKGASKGEGLGNKFLSHIKEVDAIAHVVKDFKEATPQVDVEIINLELILADLNVVEKRLEDLIRQNKKGSDKILIKTIEVLEKIKNNLEQEKLASSVKLLEEEKELVKELNLLTLKPILRILNIDEKKISSDLEKEYEIKICARLEAELTDLSEEEIKEYIKELEIKNTGLDQLIKASYKLLNLITFFTSGPQETRAWTIIQGKKAPEAAGEIHTDFQNGFIKAEIINCEDFVKAGGEAKAKEKGLMRLEGKEYVVQDGDIVHFKFSI